MKLVALLILLSLGQFVTAQNKVSGLIKGKVMDQQNKLPLPDATVTVLNRLDSAAVGFAVADKTGAFEIKNITPGAFILGITYTGYREFVKDIDINAAVSLIDLDTIFLQLDTSMLQSVIVSVPPITVKKDTVEFRASAFKTKPNATVEDLLKKLPGVEVDKEGNVTAQGEEITKIYVDGKEFFSNDPKLATKNLTAELVESIQVFDDMSDQAKFTRMDDGSRQRTINIKLKKNRKQGIFGRATAGIGTSDRYEGSASFNMFDNDRQLSVLGGANNINRLGFSSNDLINSMGGMGGITGGGGRGGGGRGGRGGNRGGGGGGGNAGNGNTQSWSAGANFRDEWGPKIDFSGNYFVSNTSTINRSKSYRQGVLNNDSTTFTNEDSYRKNTSQNHRFGFRVEYEIDSMNSILITPNISIQHSESMSLDSQITEASTPKFNRFVAIVGKTDRSNQRDGWSFNNNLLFRHRFRKPGRTFTIGWTTAVNNSEGESFNTSPYHFYNPDSTENRFDDRRQRSEQLTYSFNNTISSSLTEMIGRDKILELNYAYTSNKSNSDRDTYDYSQLSQKFDSINKPQTNYFENQFTSSRVGANFRVKKQKYDFQLGGAVQFATIDNLSNRATTNKDSLMQQRYTNFFPNASFNYNLGTRKSIRFNYRGSTQAPSVNQLQDVPDYSNSLYVRTGNPDLRQEFNHNVNLSYNTFNLTNFMYLNMQLNASTTTNKIVSTTDILETGVQLIRPENLNGSYNLSFSGTVGIPLKKVTTGRRSPVNLNLTTTLRYNRDVSKFDGDINYNYTRGIGERINFNYNIEDKLDVGANARFNYNDARYSLREENNYRYFDQTYSLDITYTFFRNFMLNSDFDYVINTGRTDGFNQNIPLWNASVSWLMFKKRNGELRFNVIDILSQNKSISRSVSPNYIEDTYTQVLQRFFMISFLYNFNKFRGVQPGNRQNRAPREYRENRGNGGNGGNGGGQRRNW
jgi:hypothetical protein